MTLWSPMRGSTSEAMRKAITTARSSLVQSLNDLLSGVSDQRILRPMKQISNVNQIFALKALYQLKRLFTSMTMPRHKSRMRTTLSRLDSSPPPNQYPRGMLACNINQMVGIQRARDTVGFCFRSIRSNHRIKMMQIIRAK